MAKAPQSVEVKPSSGGKLMAGVSSESAGLANYTRKEEFRRYLDREIRAEGYEAYRPNPTYDRLAQSIPPNTGGPITLLSEVELGDGRVTLIAGNQTTLWRYTGLEALTCFAGDYYDNEGGTYFNETQAGWIQIGSGFSASGNRWECVTIGDYIVLNNGVDLPVTYRLDETTVLPIYELREQQVASVGTICSIDDILMCMDIRQINDVAFASLMADQAAAVSAGVDSTGMVTVLAATLFTNPSQFIGMGMFWASGEQRMITGISGGYFTVNSTTPIATGPCSVENPLAYAAYTDQNNIQRYGWRAFPAMPSQPRRFGSVVFASMSNGSQVVNFKYPVRSFSELFYNAIKSATSVISFPSIYVLQAATGGGNLISPIQWAPLGSAKSVQLTQTCRSTVASIPCEAADSQASYAGVYADLVDDGSAILRGKQLRDSLVIYKEPSPSPAIFIGTYTGAQAAPFSFQKVQLPTTGQALHYKSVIISGGGGYYGSHHIYAGRNAFYKLDLFQLTPTEVPQMTPCQSLFFEQADREKAFVVENHLTREFFFGYGNGGALCMDYATGTVRSTDAALTAAAKARHPVNGSDWFVMGMADGTIRRYGLLDANPRSSGSITATSSGSVVTTSAAFFTADDVGTTLLFADGNIAAVDSYNSATSVGVIGLSGTVSAKTFLLVPGIWHRDGATYSSVLQSGMEAFGQGNNEKSLFEYSLGASSKSPSAVVTINFMAGSNPATAVDMQRGVIRLPQQFNSLRPTMIGYYIGERITVTGFSPFEITSRSFRVNQINSHGYGNLQR